MAHRPAIMFAIFSILFCVAPFAFGVHQDEDAYEPIEEVLNIYGRGLAPRPQQRAERAGYTAENHEVVTQDGYILHLDRITGSRKNPQGRNKPVVLLVHAIFDCSATWVMGSPEKSLGFILADRGYDVWMGNVRGNRYSRNHKWLSTKDKSYWLFSWHEMGMYDAPAMIDYILAKTGQPKLTYLGHSQGTTVFFVMASMRPEYQNKVKAMIALAPVAFLRYATLPVLKILAPFVGNMQGKLGRTTLQPLSGNTTMLFTNTNKSDITVGTISFVDYYVARKWPECGRKVIHGINDVIGFYEFQPSGKLIQLIGKIVCRDDTITQALCKTAIVIMAGSGEKLLNETLISEIAQYDPAGASTRQLIHYAQLVESGMFRQYDYGLFENLKRYGSKSPPDYPLQNIRIPVHLYYGNNDGFVNVKDLDNLYSKLPNSQKHMVPAPSFTHLDFVWSVSVDTDLYNNVLHVISMY